jgi:hypothetical protein
MGPFALAWLVGEGIVIYRSAKQNHAPPGPGQLLLSSGLFVMLGLLAESEKLRLLATTIAWGYDIAAFMNIFSGEALAKSTGTWPPSIAPNTVVIPTGSITTDSGGSGGTGSNGNTGGSGGGGSTAPLAPPPGMGV